MHTESTPKPCAWPPMPGPQLPKEGGTTTMSDTVTREYADGVATLTLQRPGPAPALPGGLLPAVREVAADASVRAVVLTGTGRPFCVAQDLAEHVEALGG